VKGAICLARSFKIINESLTSLDLGFNEIRVSIHSFLFSFISSGIFVRTSYGQHILHLGQDDGAFALAQALKANEDLAVTSLNLANNFFTKFGQVSFISIIMCYGIFKLLVMLYLSGYRLL
jgi:NLR family CARD domain-containing protein 3